MAILSCYGDIQDHMHCEFCVCRCRHSGFRAHVPLAGALFDMLGEQRILRFSHDDVREAIVEFDRDKRLFPIDGDVQAIEITGKLDPAVIVRIQQQDRAFEKEINLSQSQVAGIIIHQCIGRCIPLPRKAHKEIRYVGDEIVLVITVPVAVGKPSDSPAGSPVEKLETPVRSAAKEAPEALTR